MVKNILLVILAILVLGLVGYIGFQQLPSFLVQEQKTLDASGLLVSIGPSDELKLLEYVEKTVFPFDFIDPEANLAALSRVIQADRSGRLPQDILTPREWESFEAYNLARSTGFDPGTPGSPFLVLTLVYEYGYPLSDPELNPEPVIDPIVPTLQVRPPSLLRVRIEDLRRENYPYPDVRISPESWQRISGFIIAQKETGEGLEAVSLQAQEQAFQFFQSILRAAYPESIPQITFK